MINVLNNLQCPRFAIGMVQVFIDPRHDVILEDTFDELVEEIRRQEFMNICTWKSMCEWLEEKVRKKCNKG